MWKQIKTPSGFKVYQTILLPTASVAFVLIFADDDVLCCFCAKCKYLKPFEVKRGEWSCRLRAEEM